MERCILGVARRDDKISGNGGESEKINMAIGWSCRRMDERLNGTQDDVKSWKEGRKEDV